MLKKIYNLMACMLIGSMAFAQTKSVTFQVSNPDSTPVFVFGSWSNWSNWPGTPMTPIANGKYSVTIPLPANAPYEFLFVNGNGPFAKEMLNPAATCTNGNSQYTNRVLNLGSSDTALCYTWNSCATCVVTPPPSNVTVSFRVEHPDSLPVFVFGSWTGFGNWPGHLMTDSNNDSIYEFDINLPSNSNYEYLFVNGNTPVKESLNPSWPCTNGNGQYTNRVLSVGSSNVTACNIWGLCDTCGATVIPNVNVDFIVENPDSTPVYLFGSWTGFGNWPGSPMTAISPGKYKGTVSLQINSTVEYLFVNGTVPAKEILDPNWPCTNGNSQYTNRVYNVGTISSADCHVFGNCNNCSTTGVNELKKDKFAALIQSNGIIIKSNAQQIDGIEIYDVLGKSIFKSNQKFNTNSLIPADLQNNQLYFIRIKQNNNNYLIKQLSTFN